MPRRLLLTMSITLMLGCQSPPSPVAMGTPPPEPVRVSSGTVTAFENEEFKLRHHDVWKPEKGGTPFFAGWEKLQRFVRADSKGKAELIVTRAPKGVTLDQAVSRVSKQGGDLMTLADETLGGRPFKKARWTFVSLEGRFQAEGYMSAIGGQVYVLSFTLPSGSQEPEWPVAERAQFVESFQPKPNATDADLTPNYFPLSDGVTWTYAIEVDGVRRGSLTLQAGFVESKEGVVTAKVAHTTTLTGEDGKERSVKQILTYRKVADELSYVTEEGVRRIELKLPLEVGAAWMDNGLRVEAVAEEAVTVPYRDFDEAIKVTASSDGGTTSNWYADGYGLVKSEAVNSKGEALTFSLTEHRVFLFSEARKDGSNPVH